MPVKSKKQTEESVDVPEAKQVKGRSKTTKKVTAVEAVAEPTPKKSMSKGRKAPAPVEAEPVVEAAPKKTRTRKVAAVEPVVEAAPKKSRSKKAEAPVEEEVAVEAEKPKRKKRCYRVVDPKTGRTYGRYTGKDDPQASNKVFSQAKKRAKKDGKKIPTSITCYLRESTRGSDKGFYGCKVWSVALETPHTRKVWNEKKGKMDEIVYLYRNKNEAVPVPEGLPALVEKWNEAERDRKKVMEEAEAAPVPKAKGKPAAKATVEAVPKKGRSNNKSAKINC